MYLFQIYTPHLLYYCMFCHFFDICGMTYRLICQASSANTNCEVTVASTEGIELILSASVSATPARLQFQLLKAASLKKLIHSGITHSFTWLTIP